MKALGPILSLLTLGIVSLSGAQAAQAQWWNTDDPGWNDHGDGSLSILVRKQPGTLWKRKVLPTLDPGWTSMSWPSSGLSSHPVGTTFGSPVKNHILGTDPGTVKRSIDGGATWANTFGAPLGGISSAVAVTGLPGGEGNIVSLLNGKPWWRRQNLAGTLLAWTQVGSVNVATIAPGIAMTDWRTDIFAVDRVTGAVLQTTCQYPTCFNSMSTWTEVIGKTTSYQPNAVWYQDPNNGDYLLSVVVRAADKQAWEKIYNNSTGNWTAWTSRGGNLSGPVQIAKPAPGTTATRLLARSASSPNNHLVNQMGTTWNSFGKP